MVSAKELSAQSWKTGTVVANLDTPIALIPWRLQLRPVGVIESLEHQSAVGNWQVMSSNMMSILRLSPYLA